MYEYTERNKVRVEYRVMKRTYIGGEYYDGYTCTYDGDDLIEAARAVLDVDTDVMLCATIWKGFEWLCSGSLYERTARKVTYKRSVKDLAKVFESMNKGYKIM